MEVEIEDLHVQMDDISKTKQAVSKLTVYNCSDQQHLCGGL